MTVPRDYLHGGIRCGIADRRYLRRDQARRPATDNARPQGSRSPLRSPWRSCAKPGFPTHLFLCSPSLQLVLNIVLKLIE
jgi:hypothetical protein